MAEGVSEWERGGLRSDRRWGGSPKGLEATGGADDSEQDERHGASEERHSQSPVCF